MRSSRWWVVLPGALVLALSALLAHAQQPAVPAAAPTPTVDPKADELLRKMGTTLQAAKSISFAAHAIVDQARDDGQRIQYAKNQKVQLRRPDKLAGDVTGDVE